MSLTGFESVRAQFEQAGIKVEETQDRLRWTLRYGGLVPEAAVAIDYWPTSGTAYAFGKSFRPATVSALIRAITSRRIRMPDEALLHGKVCKNCGASIWWAEGFKNGMPTGKRVPIEMDGSNHFGKCPNAIASANSKADKSRGPSHD